MLGPPVLAIMVAVEAVVDRLPLWAFPVLLMVLELDVGGLVLVGNVGTVGVDVVVLLVLERGGSDSLVVGGGCEEVVAVDEDAVVIVKLKGSPVPVTDVMGKLEVVGEDEIGRLPVGELKERLVAKDELMIMKLEMVEVEERTSG